MERKHWDKKYNETHKKERAAHRAYLKENDKHYNASALVRRYRQSDLKYARGVCTLTAEWIEQNIYTKECIYCGEKDWHKLGCDRIKNYYPHRPNNVVPCCKRCNELRGLKDFVPYFEMRFMETILE